MLLLSWDEQMDGEMVISGRGALYLYACWQLSSFFLFVYLIGYDLDSLAILKSTGMTGKLLEFLLNSRSEVHGCFLHSCFMLSLKNVCFHLLHSPSHWHALRSITNSSFFSCLISSQSAFVRTFLMLNTWINFFLHCVNHKAVNTWMYITSQGFYIFVY